MLKIEAQKREKTGKKAKHLIEEGMVPAVVYNQKGESTAIKVPLGDAVIVIENASTSTFVEMTLDGKTFKVLVKEVDADPITDNLRHVSFFQLDENTVTDFRIPVKLVGVAPAVKNNLGVLIQPTKYLDVRCKLADHIEVYEVDVTKMEQPGESITLADITLPEGISFIRDDQMDLAVATIGQLQKLLETEDAEKAEAEGEEGEVELDEDGNPIEPAEGAEGEGEEAPAEEAAE